MLPTLHAKGFHDYYVHVNENGALLKKLFGERRRSFLGRWVTCFPGEVIEKLKDRFREDRKVRPQSMAAIPANIAQRTTWFPNRITDACVLFNWDRHFGTIKFQQVVWTFADDRTRCPKWNRHIANLIRDALRQQGLTVFLVFLNPNGRPCRSIHQGTCFLATDNEIESFTRREFQQRRRRRMV
jgi:hypothetical protein